MTKELDFPEMLSRTLKWEGGYVNHPKDPGGATMKGVTQKTYDAYRRSVDMSPRNVKDITFAELEDIYEDNYFVAVSGHRLPPAIAFQVFDAAVNSGPARAKKWLQQALGLPADGIIGPKTLAAANAKHVSDLEICLEFLDLREAFVRSLPTFSTFGKGWMNRINGNRQYAKEDTK